MSWCVAASTGLFVGVADGGGGGLLQAFVSSSNLHPDLLHCFFPFPAHGSAADATASPSSPPKLFVGSCEKIATQALEVSSYRHRGSFTHCFIFFPPHPPLPSSPLPSSPPSSPMPPTSPSSPASDIASSDTQATEGSSNLHSRSFAQSQYDFPRHGSASAFGPPPPSSSTPPAPPPPAPPPPPSPQASAMLQLGPPDDDAPPPNAFHGRSISSQHSAAVTWNMYSNRALWAHSDG
mmetsp:Transcript_27486/g.58395  ORF Transcript_27486/g.58395 Transcript_27486/m.58395 type:complete len:236 (+) Transcript_27486:321-1028(+)